MYYEGPVSYFVGFFSASRGIPGKILEIPAAKSRISRSGNPGTIPGLSRRQADPVPFPSRAIPGSRDNTLIFMLLSSIVIVDRSQIYIIICWLRINTDFRYMYTCNQARGRTNNTTMHWNKNINIKGISGDPFFILLYPFQYVLANIQPFISTIILCQSKWSSRKTKVFHLHHLWQCTLVNLILARGSTWIFRSSMSYIIRCIHPCNM